MVLAPSRMAALKAGAVSSGATAGSPRCPTTAGAQIAGLGLDLTVAEEGTGTWTTPDAGVPHAAKNSALAATRDLRISKL
jgi:hypothetical protein